MTVPLKVPPVALLFPTLPDGDAEMLPGSHTTAANAMRWFTGEAGADEDDETVPCDEARLINLTRKRFDVERKARHYISALELLQLSGSKGQQVANEFRDLANAAEEITDLNRQIATVPGAVVAGITEEGAK